MLVDSAEEMVMNYEEIKVFTNIFLDSYQESFLLLIFLLAPFLGQLGAT